MRTMFIKDGFNSQPLEIRLNGRKENGTAEIWIEMFQPIRQPDEKGRIETLHYATIKEIKTLRDECNLALKDLLGL